MTRTMRDRTAIVGVGATPQGRTEGRRQLRAGQAGQLLQHRPGLPAGQRQVGAHGHGRVELLPLGQHTQPDARQLGHQVVHGPAHHLPLQLWPETGEGGVAEVVGHEHPHAEQAPPQGLLPRRLGGPGRLVQRRLRGPGPAQQRGRGLPERARAASA